MFGQAGHTEYDVRFELFGIPVRIHPFFWLTSAMLVWNRDNPSWVFIGILCVLISVLVHELGHAVMSRRYGYPSDIVLFIFGGYATASRFSTWKNVKVSAAGPGAGLVLFVLTYLLFRFLRANHPDMVSTGHMMTYFLGQMLFMNLMWSIINLIPVLPLDGGRIVESLMRRYRPRGADMNMLKVFMLSAGAVCAWALYCMKDRDMNLIPIPGWMLPGLRIEAIQPEPTMLAVLFGALCALHAKNYNDMQQRY